MPLGRLQPLWTPADITSIFHRRAESTIRCHTSSSKVRQDARRKLATIVGPARQHAQEGQARCTQCCLYFLVPLLSLRSRMGRLIKLYDQPWAQRCWVADHEINRSR